MGGWKYFYPRPPRGERRDEDGDEDYPKDFYPRPPRGERREAQCSMMVLSIFLSTPSARRATFAQGHVASTKCISIHALREESDPGFVNFW